MKKDFKKILIIVGLKSLLGLLKTITLGIPNLMNKIKTKITELENDQKKET